MARGKSDLELACEVYWGELVDPDSCHLSCTSNPEQQMIIKDTLEKLSSEAKLVATVLFNMPDEMFTKTGRVIRERLINYMKIHHNWSAEKTRIVQDEIAEMIN